MFTDGSAGDLCQRGVLAFAAAPRVGISSADEKKKDSEKFSDLPKVTRVSGVIHT